MSGVRQPPTTEQEKPMSENPIDPSTCPPDRIYMGTLFGERVAMQRCEPDSRYAWKTLGDDTWTSDWSVFDLVPMGEMRDMTRDDLPDADVITDDHHFFVSHVITVLDAVVEHRNSRGGLVIDTRDPLDRALRELDGWKGRAEEAEDRLVRIADEADRLAVRADYAVRERDEAIRDRDEAVGRAEKAEAERDEGSKQREGADYRARCATSHAKAVETLLERVGRERDEWNAHAVKAEAERDELETRAKRAGGLLLGYAADADEAGEDLDMANANLAREKQKCEAALAKVEEWRERAETAEAKTSAAQQDADRADPAVVVVRWRTPGR